MMAAILVMAGWLSLGLGQAAEVWVTALGSVVICAAALQENWLRGPLWTYFGFGTLAYLWMVPMIGSEEIVPRWLAYQAIRVAGLAWFVWSAVRFNEDGLWTGS